MYEYKNFAQILWCTQQQFAVKRENSATRIQQQNFHVQNARKKNFNPCFGVCAEFVNKDKCLTRRSNYVATGNVYTYLFLEKL